METLIVYMFLTSNIASALGQALEVKTEDLNKKNMAMCNKLAEKPYFETELVVGKPWRIYYTWNIKMDNKCLDMVFRNATPGIIQRIYSDMYDYMEQQPYWDGATLHVTAGSARQEMLFFAEQGAAGAFNGVPNVIREGSILPVRGGVPLLRFQLKLIRSGKYLLMMDCHLGIATLSARPDHPPFRSEIAAAISALDIGDGFPACIQEKNKEEQFMV